ncbi:MAG: GNAT family N-acetyltransferase [Planctomycetes bacterium]|nr:GNAT family N-acetyltransferase [Planctomycetota bacterium]
MQIRQATAADLDRVVEFNQLLAEESEGKTLDLAKLRPGVAAALADEHKGLYFLAEDSGQAIGQMGVTYEWSDWRDGWFWWIQSVYVRPEFRRRGVFRVIFEHIVAVAQRSGVIGMRLYVERDNAIAHKTYLKMGYEWTTYQVMEKYPLDGPDCGLA